MRSFVFWDQTELLVAQGRVDLISEISKDLHIFQAIFLFLTRSLYLTEIVFQLLGLSVFVQQTRRSTSEPATLTTGHFCLQICL